MKPVEYPSKYLNFNSNVAYQWGAISHRVFFFFRKPYCSHRDNKEKDTGKKSKRKQTESRFETLADSRLETKEVGSRLTEIFAYAGASRLVLILLFLT